MSILAAFRQETSHADPWILFAFRPVAVVQWVVFALEHNIHSRMSELCAGSHECD